MIKTQRTGNKQPDKLKHLLAKGKESKSDSRKSGEQIRTNLEAKGELLATRQNAYLVCALT